MYDLKIDTKTIFIFLLGLVIILMILFKNSKNIDYYEKQINLLNEKNNDLKNKNDSLNVLNTVLRFEIEEIKKDVDSVSIVLVKNEEEIRRLKIKRNEIFNNVNSMGVDDVTRNFSDYLKRRD